MKELICIVCPRGCHLTIDDNNNVTGNMCPRGKQYALNEITNPTRMVTSTVKVDSKLFKRLPVITSKEVSKSKMFEVVKALDGIVVKPPVYLHDVIIKNVCGLGVDIIATRTILE